MTVSDITSAGEQAGRRAKELADRIAALRSGVPVSGSDVATARKRAEESLRRAEAAQNRVRVVVGEDAAVQQCAAEIRDDGRADDARQRAVRLMNVRESLGLASSPAQDAPASDRRLATVVRAIEADLSSDTALRRALRLTCDLVGAGFGAIALEGDDRRPDRFIHIGCTERVAADLLRRADPPGETMEEHVDGPAPADPAAGTGEQPMLQVPIRVDDSDDIGALVLCGPTGDAFGPQQTELARVLAAAIGNRVGAIRQQATAEQRRRWLEALSDIQARLLRFDGEDPLAMIADRAQTIADADTVMVELITADQQNLLVEVAVGAGAAGLRGRRFALDDSIRGRVVRSGEPLREVVGPDGQTRAEGHCDGLGAGPVLVLPLRGAAHPRGLLVLTRRDGRDTFSMTEMNQASAFATQASLALELADSRSLHQQTLLLLDRERIARDLHDHVIQELFSIGLRLDGAVSQIHDPPVAQRIQGCVEDLDAAIRRIRSSIFTLRNRFSGPEQGLRERILEVRAGLQDALGFTPAVSFSGAVDTGVDAGLASEVEACVREALTNVARHAQARWAAVDLIMADNRLTVRVTDNGCGMPAEPSRSSGVTNLRNRAHEHGGSLEIRAREGGGTVLEWTVLVTP